MTYVGVHNFKHFPFVCKTLMSENSFGKLQNTFLSSGLTDSSQYVWKGFVNHSQLAIYFTLNVISCNQFHHVCKKCVN